ncbi:hypothetical protein [Aeromicrobium sp. UC242_57]|uniref:hypothetical protein n=1 Tax=Aeromicrobium sp. UC242_57 TaxID=3374624 RepID=UPI0037984A47
MRPGLWALPAALLMAPLVQVVHTTPAYAANEPVIDVQAPDGAWEGWYRRPVTIQVKARSTFPLAILTWSRKRPGGVVDDGHFDAGGTSFEVSERGATNYVFRATDLFGGTAEAKYGVGIDPDAPTISFGSLPDTIVLGQGAEVPFTYSCAEDLTQVKSCTAPRASGQLIPSSTLGVVRETVRAEDMVGNVRTRLLATRSWARCAARRRHASSALSGPVRP